MRVLIVDDEVYAVEAIREMVDWEALGIGEVVSAYSMKQAQKILTEKPCDILICDIEMPRGSGLELLSWMREEGMDTVALFLTSHANFNYANRAIKLDTFDYILKPADPAEIQKVLSRAVEKVEENRVQKRRLEQAGYWDDSAVQRMEEFILRVADGRIPADREEIFRQARLSHLSEISLDGEFYPLLIQLRAETEDEKEWGKGLVEYGLKNILSEVLSNLQKNGVEPLIPQLAPRYYATFVPQDGMDWEAFIALCQQALSACLSAMPCAVTFYPGEPVAIEGVASETEALLKRASDNILYDNTVYLPPPAGILQQEEESWQKVLDEGADPDELGTLLDRAARGGLLTRTYLRRMFVRTQDYIDRHGAGTPHGGAVSDIEQLQATASLDGMKDWLARSLSQVPERELDERQDTRDVVENLRRYIRGHLNEELGRNELAQLVYLNPDYLSHIFRERVGVPLVDFITAERMKKARELLLSTDLPIRDVALAVGYANISYFSRQFKRAQGQTPLEFRKSAGKIV